MFWNFHLLENDKTANNSATTEVAGKNKNGFGILRIFNFCLTKFKKIKFYLKNWALISSEKQAI
jgi:hypothetical protein